jgi:hypothetical protein
MFTPSHLTSIYLPRLNSYKYAYPNSAHISMSTPTQLTLECLPRTSHISIFLPQLSSHRYVYPNTAHIRMSTPNTAHNIIYPRTSHISIFTTAQLT